MPATMNLKLNLCVFPLIGICCFIMAASLAETLVAIEERWRAAGGAGD